MDFAQIVGFFFDKKCYKIVFPSRPGKSGKSAVIRVIRQGVSTPVSESGFVRGARPRILEGAAWLGRGLLLRPKDKRYSIRAPIVCPRGDSITYNHLIKSSKMIGKRSSFASITERTDTHVHCSDLADNRFPAGGVPVIAGICGSQIWDSSS